MTASIPNQSETSGQTVLYLHGLPGSAAELATRPRTCYAPHQ